MSKVGQNYFRSPKQFLPRPDKGPSEYGGLYGMAAIEQFTGLQARILRYLYAKFAFPLLKLPGGGWYLHKDLFYMWCLSWTRQQLIEYRNPGDIIIADALKRLEIMRQDMGLTFSDEEVEMFRRVYVRIFGTDEAINMVTGYDGTGEKTPIAA